MPLGCQIGQEPFDFGRSHLRRMTLGVKQNKLLNPGHVGILGTQAVMLETNFIAYLIQSFFWRCRCRICFHNMSRLPERILSKTITCYHEKRIIRHYALDYRTSDVVYITLGMFMNNELRDDLIESLIDIIPFGDVPKGISKLLYNFGIGKYSRYKTFNLVEVTASDIASRFYAAEGIDRKNPGAAKSAAYNIVEIIKKTKIDSTFIISCNIDPEIIFTELNRRGEEIMHGASGIRKGFVETGLRAFAETIAARAMEFPNIQTEIYRVLLRHVHAQQAVQPDAPTCTG